MASNGKKGGGDFVLESRHLVGLFLVLVVIFGIVFTLGYLMGRTQYDTKLRNAASTPFETTAAAPAPPRSAIAKKDADDAQPEPTKSDSGWDFYHATNTTEPREDLQTANARPAEPVQPRPAKTVLNSPKSGAKFSSQRGAANSRNEYMLQIAAVRSERDALALSQALQQKRITAFVVKPASDKYYRVQVGPYPDSKSAAIARRDLESKGFKPIIKH